MSRHRRAVGQKPQIAVAVRMPTVNLEFSRQLQAAMAWAAEDAALKVYYAALKGFYQEQDLRGTALELPRAD